METKELQAFTSQKFGTIRTVMHDGEPWFVAIDVCRALEIDRTAVRRLDHDEVFTVRLTHGENGRTSDTNLDNDERAMFNIGRQGKANITAAVSGSDTDERMTLNFSEGHSGQRGGARSANLNTDEVFTLRLTQGETSRTSDTNIVNESGLYSLILGSRKPEAHAFKRWVTHEVLPAIRRTGGYNARQGDAAGELLTVIRQERERLDALERELRRVRPAPALYAGETRERLCEAADTFVAAVLGMTRSGELRVEPLDAPEGDGDPDGYEDEQYLYLRPSTAYGRYARRCEEYGTPRPDTQRSLYRGLRERGAIEPDNHGGTATRNKLVHGRTRRLLWIRKNNERA